MNKKTGFHLALRRAEKERATIQWQIDDLEHTLVTLRCFLKANEEVNWESKIREDKEKIAEAEAKLKELKAIQNGHCAINDLYIEDVIVKSEYCEKECQYFVFCKEYKNLDW